MWMLYIDDTFVVERMQKAGTPYLRLASGEWLVFFSSEDAAQDFREANGVIDPPVMAEVVR